MEMAETGTINLETQAAATHTRSSVGPETGALGPAPVRRAWRLRHGLCAGQGRGAAWNGKI